MRYPPCGKWHTCCDKMIAGIKVTFTVSIDFSKIDKQPDVLKLNQQCQNCYSLKSTSEKFPVHVMREIKLCKPFSVFLCEENSLEMFCLRNTKLFDSIFKVFHKTVSDSSRKCVRKSSSTSRVVKIVPQKKEAHHGYCIWLFLKVNTSERTEV